jgi:hypothetical protein
MKPVVLRVGGRRDLGSIKEARRGGVMGLDIGKDIFEKKKGKGKVDADEFSEEIHDSGSEEMRGDKASMSGHSEDDSSDLDSGGNSSADSKSVKPKANLKKLSSFSDANKASSFAIIPEENLKFQACLRSGSDGLTLDLVKEEASLTVTPARPEREPHDEDKNLTDGLMRFPLDRIDTPQSQNTGPGTIGTGNSSNSDSLDAKFARDMANKAIFFKSKNPVKKSLNAPGSLTMTEVPGSSPTQERPAHVSHNNKNPEYINAPIANSPIRIKRNFNPKLSPEINRSPLSKNSPQENETKGVKIPVNNKQYQQIIKSLYASPFDHTKVAGGKKGPISVVKKQAPIIKTMITPSPRSRSHSVNLKKIKEGIKITTMDGLTDGPNTNIFASPEKIQQSRRMNGLMPIVEPTGLPNNSMRMSKRGKVGKSLNNADNENNSGCIENNNYIAQSLKVPLHVLDNISNNSGDNLSGKNSFRIIKGRSRSTNVRRSTLGNRDSDSPGEDASPKNFDIDFCAGEDNFDQALDANILVRDKF